jgi:hypothetical protein
MAQRARTMSQLIDELRAEIRAGGNAALGSNMRGALVQTLQRVQEELYTSFDWPFLRVDREAPVIPGTTMYAIPDDVDPGEVQRVFVREQARADWRLLDANPLPSDAAPLDEPSGDPRRWWTELDATVNTEQIVIWPTPIRAATLLVRGKRPLLPFVDDSDRCTLDGTLIVLAAASEYLADAKSNRAQAVQAKAAARFRKLKAAQGAGRRTGPLMVGKAFPRSPRLVRYLDYMPTV